MNGRQRVAGPGAPAFWAFPFALVAILGLTAFFDFVIFHTLAEFFAITVAFVMFALAWYTSDFTRNRFLLFIACGYFWVGGLDLAHALSYKGLELLPHSGTNASAQFWIVTRYYEAGLLLLAPLLADRAFGRTRLFAVTGAVALCLALWVVSGNVPDAFVEGAGLTPFKVYSEYAIVAVLAVAVWGLLRNRHIVTPDECVLLVLSIGLTMAAELAFTTYVDPYGLSNLLGHVLKLFSYWMIFQAVVANNLRRPYLELQGALSLAHRNRQLAERANRAKSDFLSMMSHDLRTPLNAIMGFSDLMRQQTFGPLGGSKYPDYAEAIHRSGAHLVNLINDILDLSRIESGNYVLAEEPIDLTGLLSDIHVCFDPDAAFPATGRGSVRLDVPEDAPRLLADRRAMSQIVSNLIGNAVKFGAAGGEIVVSWRPDDAGCWSLSVRDRGCGIPPEKIGRITRPFVQGDPHHSRSHEGVGLGLHIVQLLTRLHEGRLRIDSVVGRGTTIAVVFPAARILHRPTISAKTGDATPAADMTH